MRKIIDIVDFIQYVVMLIYVCTNIAPGTFVSGYATAEMTLRCVQLVAQLWSLVEKMSH